LVASYSAKILARPAAGAGQGRVLPSVVRHCSAVRHCQPARSGWGVGKAARSGWEAGKAARSGWEAGKAARSGWEAGKAGRSVRQIRGR